MTQTQKVPAGNTEEPEIKKKRKAKAVPKAQKEKAALPNSGEKPAVRVEICLPFLRYKLPVNDRQAVLYTAEKSELYTKALLMEMEDVGTEFVDEGVRAGSIVFRGGAGLEDPKTLAKLLREVKKAVPAAENCEVSLEANLGEIDFKRLEEYRRAGIRRFFIRAYSFSPATCRKIGCLFDQKQIDELADASLRVNKVDLALGLYYMTPQEDRQDFRRTMETTEYMKLSEIRLLKYPVKEEKPEDTAQRKLMDTFIRSYMGVMGFDEYQTMAFAKKGKGSRDYLLSSQNAEKVGFGMGAETCLGGFHSHNLRNFEGYIRYAGDYEKLAQVHVPDDVVRLDDLATPEDVRKLLEELKESLKQ